MARTSTLKNHQLLDVKTNELLVELEYLNEKTRLDQVNYDVSLKTKNAILSYAKKAVL